MRTRTITAVLAALPMLAAAQNASKVTEIDLDKVKGQHVTRLAWSADGTQLYVQSMDGEFGMAPKKLYHHVVTVTDGSRRSAEAEPEWAAAYWNEKSAQTSPDGPPLKIDLSEEVKTQKTTSTPMGGALARGGGSDETGGVTGDALSAKYNQTQIKVITTSLMGTPVGVFEGTVLVPGRTFGWAPKGFRAIAFADPKNGKIVLMDDKGGRKEIDGSKDALLPAWSPDGAKVAWLQKDGKKKFHLMVATVR